MPSFFQWVKFGFGALAWKRKYPEAVNEFAALVQSTFAPTADPGVTPSEALEKVQTGEMTREEQAAFDRASGTGGL